MEPSARSAANPRILVFVCKSTLRKCSLKTINVSVGYKIWCHDRNYHVNYKLHSTRVIGNNLIHFHFQEYQDERKHARPHALASDIGHELKKWPTIWTPYNMSYFYCKYIEHKLQSRLQSCQLQTTFGLRYREQSYTFSLPGITRWEKTRAHPYERIRYRSRIEEMVRNLKTIYTANLHRMTKKSRLWAHARTYDHD